MLDLTGGTRALAASGIKTFPQRFVCTVRYSRALCCRMDRVQQGEIGHALQNPNSAIDIAVGPPFPELIPQDPNAAPLAFARQFDSKPKRFIFKKAHLSREDFRIFDGESGMPVAVSHHWGKNPYASLDPLGVSQQTHYGMLGEMESLCHVAGTARYVQRNCHVRAQVGGAATHPLRTIKRLAFSTSCVAVV